MTKRLSEIANLPMDHSAIFSEIILTDEETKAAIAGIKSDDEPTQEQINVALLAVRQRKYAEQQFKIYTERLNKTSLIEPLTSEQLFDKIKKTPWLVLDEHNEQIISDMCLYFTGDQRSPYDPKKGLFLYGPVGTGKTTIISLFRLNQVCSFPVVACRQISYDFQRHGHEAVGKYKFSGKFPEAKQLYGQEETGYCFDDLGTEIDKKHFGNESNVMAEIILDRYDNKELKGKTHVTSNLNSTMIEERYGYRVRSRIREMFNVVIFEENAPDRRK